MWERRRQWARSAHHGDPHLDLVAWDKEARSWDGSERRRTCPPEVGGRARAAPPMEGAGEPLGRRASTAPDPPPPPCYSASRLARHHLCPRSCLRALLHPPPLLLRLHPRSCAAAQSAMVGSIGRAELRIHRHHAPPCRHSATPPMGRERRGGSRGAALGGGWSRGSWSGGRWALLR